MPWWLMLLPIIELGSISGSAGVYPGRYEIPDDTYFVVMGAEARLFDTVYVAGGVENWFVDQQDSWQSSPIFDRYHFEAGVEYKKFSLSFYHRCDHPVISNEYPANIRGGVTKVSLAYNGRWK